MSDEGKGSKAKKSRSLGKITIFEVQDNGDLKAVSISSTEKFESTAKAESWIKNNVDGLEGKTLQIGIMKPSITLEVETVKKVTLK